jgi:hypothetical protein
MKSQKAAVVDVNPAPMQVKLVAHLMKKNVSTE